MIYEYEATGVVLTGKPTPLTLLTGHVQYISTVIKDDRKFFRKKYGISFLLDVIRQYYATCELLNSDDSKTIRVSLLGLVKYYMQKELNVKEVEAILGFLSSVKEEVLVRITVHILQVVLL
jgi:hypothetical protein